MMLYTRFLNSSQLPRLPDKYNEVPISAAVCLRMRYIWLACHFAYCTRASLTPSSHLPFWVGIDMEIKA